MYAIHTTKGFIIESRPWSDAGKTLLIFTKDLGLVIASAQGIRLEKSKLRYHAQEYTLGAFSLVRGKEFWRLTSAQSIGAREATGATYRFIAPRVANVLKRLISGEEPHPDLFDMIESVLSFASEHADLDQTRLQTLESIALFCILRSLGYIAPPSGLASIAPPASLDEIDAWSAARPEIVKHINNAFRESHL